MDGKTEKSGMCMPTVINLASAAMIRAMRVCLMRAARWRQIRPITVRSTRWLWRPRHVKPSGRFSRTAIASLDARFPWLRSAEKRLRKIR
jgi:hypothetical protein